MHGALSKTSQKPLSFASLNLLSQELYPVLFDIAELKHFPKETGVYLMKDAEGVVLYIGKAKNLKSRIKQYFDVTDARPMIPFLVSKIASIDIIVTASEREALILENNLIKEHQPKYNALLKDDKTFVSLMINTEHPWPMLKLVRHKGEKKERYFGPYTSTIAARATLDLLSKIFPLRQCSDKELASRTRPCILHAMKRCLAPCVNKCSKEDYHLFVNKTIQFLKGEDKELLQDLKVAMEQASEQLEFEKAAALLHTIKQLEMISKQGKSVVESNVGDCDALGIYREAHKALISLLSFREGRLVSSDHFYFDTVAEDNQALLETFLLQHYVQKNTPPPEILLPEKLSSLDLISSILKEKTDVECIIKHPEKGDKKKLLNLAEHNAKVLFYQEEHGEQRKESLLTELQDRLSLSRYPSKIECFDTSNLSGTSPIASLVVFSHGNKAPSKYRTYKIKGEKTDDYHALKEVLFRRYSKGKIEDDLPDLIIVDGGKGQLSVAHTILQELEIASCDLIALAKEEARHDKGLTQERVFILSQKEPILLPQNSPTLFFLQQVRDEAHRRAITLHRVQRKNTLLTSELDQLPGIGPIKKKKLLQHFGSVKRLKEATPDELLQVKGLTQKDLDTLQRFIQS